MPATALAWKPTTHVYLANLALEDALDDGKVTINRVDYASGSVLKQIGQYQVDSAILAALRNYKAQYHAGILALMPTRIFSLDSRSFTLRPKRYRHRRWLQRLALQYLWNQSQQPENATPAIRAFVVGYLTHAAGDMFGHTFINTFSGDLSQYPAAGPANAIKHVVVEGYVDKRLPQDAFGNDFFTGSIDGVSDFIYRTMIDARPGTNLTPNCSEQGAAGRSIRCRALFDPARRVAARHRHLLRHQGRLPSTDR